MDEFASRKRRKLFCDLYADPNSDDTNNLVKEEQPRKDSVRERNDTHDETKNDEESTDVKLALLLSLFPDVNESVLLDVLVSYDGCVAAASAALENRHDNSSPKKRTLPSGNAQRSAITGIQTSLLTTFSLSKDRTVSSSGPSKSLTKRGKTLFLYSPKDIAQYTPCSIIHNFLPADEANALLVELLEESKTFEPYTFQLFDNKVQSHHTNSFYVSTAEEMQQQTSEYTYNGTFRTDVRHITPWMCTVRKKVQHAVNEEVWKRIQSHYPDGKKLPYMSSKEWVPNVALVNCYAGPTESVGYHSDQLTYLGPRAIVGSLSLGVAREFRVRKIVARDGDEDDHDDDDDDTSCGNNEKRADSTSPTKKKRNSKIADAEGQISIHLPHNSLLVMHAEMQEEWKHSIPAVQTISSHPIAGNRRINVTYRWYRESLHPKNTPRCRCGIPTVLRCVQRKQETRGRYMWMCFAGYSPGRKGCSFFQWAEFDDDGEPSWDRMKK